MAQVPGMGDLSSLIGFFSQSPDVNLGLANLPQKEGEVPMPYSPEGWQASKLTAPVSSPEAQPEAAPKKGEKKASTGFTPEQALALQKLVTVEQPKPLAASGGGGGGAGGRSQVGQMQQVQAGGVTTAPRASLGQILYGGRKF